jgi:hypothetical protein
MHELVHLDFIQQARQESKNQLFISNQTQRELFLKSIETDIKKLHKTGIAEPAITKYCNELFEGLNRQIFNAPIDLFIEDYLYTEHSDLRPFQFISCLNMQYEAINAVTNKRVVELSPKSILSKSKVYNLVGALQFKTLYGVDLIKNFNANTLESNQSSELYNEYLEYKDDRSPAEEYELLLHWAQDLNVDKFFELVDENNFRKNRTNTDSLLKSIEENPFVGVENDLHAKSEMEQFQSTAKEMGLNMAVVMFMVDAMRYFALKKNEEIKKIAFEIAVQGVHGYSPAKDNYRISSLPGKVFSGFHILAYYYVSWSIAIPEMVDQLKLPYENEYKMATEIFNKSK